VMGVSNIAASSHSSDCDRRRTAIDRESADTAARPPAQTMRLLWINSALWIIGP
jgi:hypothetical protein